MNDELERALREADAGGEAPVYLVAGEEYLVRKAAEQLLARLVPGGAGDLNCVVMDGASPKEVALELATLPMFGGRKVVYLRDPEFLAPKRGRADALGRAREAWKANRRREAARRVLALAGRAGFGGPEALDPEAPGAPTPEDWERELGVVLAEVDVAFLREVAAFCRAEGLSAAGGDEAALLEWLTARPAKGQVLLIVASELEKKAAFVKRAAELGRFIELKVAAKLDKLDLGDFVRGALAPFGKSLGPGALDALKDRVGANFRLLESELVKLALAADGAVISQELVRQLVAHVREEDFFELSEALQRRDFAAASKYLDEALAQGAPLLKLHGAVTSIVRGLALGREDLEAFGEGRAPRSMADFEARLWPRVKAQAEAAGAKPPHPYAAFLRAQAAGRFTRAELLEALVACAEADLALKRGGGRLVLERLLWTLGGRAAPSQVPLVG